MTNEEIARAISGHRFDVAYPYLEDDVSWTLVGHGSARGEGGIHRRLRGDPRGAGRGIHGVPPFRVLVGEDWVVIDSLADYSAVDAPTSTVASCDIYRFRDGRVTELTSYNIELGD